MQMEPSYKFHHLKKLAFNIGIILLISCKGNTDCDKLRANVATLQLQNDSLKKEINDIKPGLGDMMLMVQVHHGKLWFAGKENNWALAQFEHNEIVEILKQAETIETDRKEVKLFKVMIYPQLDSLNYAIKNKDSKEFVHYFHSLTNACNNCHNAAAFPFNRIIIPDQPPYSNQDFAPEK